VNILITNVELDLPSGTTTYVRDLALELQRQGHEPMVYTLRTGVVARELQDAGILVTRHIRKIRRPPDVIHCHHRLTTLNALRRFPAVPAIYVCHDHTHFWDGAVIHPQISRYFGVSQLCVDRLLREGVPPEVGLLLNSVDVRRFAARARLPASARRALVFSNYAHAGTHLPAVSEACREAGLELDVIGSSSGNSLAHPETALGRYDIVFAKARAALEAMATGAAVVLCDFGGVGPLVTTANFDGLRPLNFGYQSLRDPLAAECVLRQIRRYDPEDAARVSAKVRTGASLEQAVRQLHGIYQNAISGEPGLPRGARSSLHSRRALPLWESIRTSLVAGWLAFPAPVRKVLKQVPVVRELVPKIRDLIA
jgi:glycosyltransferase involved in cell wall biosynthesis